jgi:hypothetical protein
VSDVVTLETVAELRRLWGEWQRRKAERKAIDDDPDAKAWSRAMMEEGDAYEQLAAVTILESSLPALLDLAERALRQQARCAVTLTLDGASVRYEAETPGELAALTADPAPGPTDPVRPSDPSMDADPPRPFVVGEKS